MSYQGAEFPPPQNRLYGEIRTNASGSVTEASEKTARLQDQVFSILSEALVFLENRTGVDSFYTGPSWQEAVNARINRIGALLEGVGDDPNLTFLEDDAAYYAGDLTEQAKLERFRQRVIAVIRLIRSGELPSILERRDDT